MRRGLWIISKNPETMSSDDSEKLVPCNGGCKGQKLQKQPVVFVISVARPYLAKRFPDWIMGK